MIDGQGGQFQRRGTRGDDHVVAFDLFRALRRGYAHQLRAHEFGLAVDDADFELGARFFKAGLQRGCDLALAVHDGGHVRLERAFSGDAEFRQPSAHFQHVGGRAQGFGGDAARVQARAPEFRPFHERHFYPGLRRRKRRRIASRPGPDYGQFHIASSKGAA